MVILLLLVVRVVQMNYVQVVLLLIIVKHAHLGGILMGLLVLNVMLHVTVVLGEGLIPVTHVVIIFTTMREIVKILALIIIMLMLCLKTAKVVLK